VVLGRQGGGPADVELQLAGTDADSGISKRHCAFQRRRDGRWVVRDQGSTNGTRVNDGRRLGSGESWVLNDEDRIFLGAWSCLTVHIVEGPAD
jgi:predicted component of type VI protein secretion system